MDSTPPDPGNAREPEPFGAGLDVSGSDGQQHRRGRRRGHGRRRGRRNRRGPDQPQSSGPPGPGPAPAAEHGGSPNDARSGATDAGASQPGRPENNAEDGGSRESADGGHYPQASHGGGQPHGGPYQGGQGGHGGRSRRRRGRGQRHGDGYARPEGAREERGDRGDRGGGGGGAIGEIEGLLLIEQASHGHMRLRENSFLPSSRDVHVSPRLVQRYQLRDGALIKGPYGRGQGRHRFELIDVASVDGMSPDAARALPRFKALTSIDPDFHYEVGDSSKDTSMRVLDIICPVGRGQRGLLVAPPRAGKTILLQKFACAIEATYPDVYLIVLLVDERPEEATEWRRIVKGDVFVSTNDELPNVHVELAEAVCERAKRLVELGREVVLLLDSITRLARAYNHVAGTSGKTMSGGLDSRAMERPRQFFGSARNTEEAGSLTILGTTLVETGSRMDQLIFEEFKGTGNMELVLSRKLADRRIFPAIDIERSGTRKEEKLFGKARLRHVTNLRRVLLRLHFAEAMELLVSRLDDVERTDDFLDRFELDPEAEAEPGARAR